MLRIENLSAGIQGKIILKNINLDINRGEFHVIMGRNGTGKSTLSNLITGREGYVKNSGKLLYGNEDLTNLIPEERATKGIFMSFQYPVSIPGINCMHFLRTAVNSIRKSQGNDEYEAGPFIKIFKEKLELVGLDESFVKRSVNDGFSGGEKKRFEILQMLLIEPKLIILDETDSGLDIDALKIISEGIKSFRTKDNAFLLITHYYRILEYLKPDHVHVLLDGKIVKSGDETLALKLEQKGYSWLE
jgi:Fe-S cluster assembly ATP-binding protein